jgi:two-component system chemotaxis response regulator CheB
MGPQDLAQDLNVLVVDDSLTYRIILREVLRMIPNVQLAGTVSNGKIAMNQLNETQPNQPIDMVLLDLEMPEMDGLATLQAIRRQYPDIGVVMVSGANRHSADITIQALEAGALDFISKPEHEDSNQNVNALRNKLMDIIAMFRKARPAIKKAREKYGPPPSAPTATAPAAPPATASVEPPPTMRLVVPAPAKPVVPTPTRIPYPFRALAIGISTGGPKALNELIPNLPGNLGVPVLLVQHMPPLFTQSLANSLNRISALTVKEAEEGEPVLANTVYIAPGGRHMTVVHQAGEGKSPRVVIKLTDDPPENSCRPAADVLFRSVAEVYQRHVLSVVMTGMGNDGALGVSAMKRHGAYSLTQSEGSCVVYGMPKAVFDMGLSDEVLDLPELAPRIANLIQRGGK